jgi:hypothetical protein
LYGEKSPNIAKTLKVIGTLLIIQSNPVEAKIYLNRAMAIFEARGMLKMLKEVKQKLKMV